MTNILSKGFGRIPKILLLDPRIPIVAKAILALICSFMKKGKITAYPGRNLILHRLRIVSNTYYKNLNYLLDNGIVSVTQIRNPDGNGRFSHNEYCIVSYPDFYESTVSDVKGKMAETA